MSQGASFGYIGVDGNSHIGYGDIDPNRFSINSQGLIREIPQQTGIGTLAQQPVTQQPVTQQPVTHSKSTLTTAHSNMSHDKQY